MKYTVKNFKIFDEKGATFEIAPITLLTGCNCSGKSSLVKSMMMLGEYLKKVKSCLNMDLRNKGEALMQTVDFAAGIKDTGGFDNVLNEKNTNGLITFQYTVDSNLLLEDVTVTFSFIKDPNDSLGRNGKLHQIVFQRADGTVFYKAGPDLHSFFEIDLTSIKDAFLDVALRSVLINFEDKINQEVRNIDTLNAIGTNDALAKAQKIVDDYSSRFDHIKSSLLLDYDYHNYHNKEIPLETRKIFNGILDPKTFEDEDIIAMCKYKSVLYLPWLNILKGVSKENVRDVIEDKLKSAELTETENICLNFVLKDFEDSNFNNFYDYYLSMENYCLAEEGDFHKRLGEENESFFWSAVVGELVMVDYSDRFSVVKSSLSTAIQSLMIANGVFDGEWVQIKGVTRSVVFLIMAYLYGKLDPEYAKNNIENIMADYDIEMARIQVKSKIYNSMQNYADALWNELIVEKIPEYISNLSFVGSNRAIAQRLYSFDKQDSELNQYVKTNIELQYKYDSLTPIWKEMLLNRAKRVKKDKELIDFTEEIDKVIKLPKDFINRWLQKYEICDAYYIDTVVSDSVTIGCSICLEKNGKKHSIADEGYGCIQIFTVLLAIQNLTYMSYIDLIKNQINHYNALFRAKDYENHPRHYALAVEEPENHLHPKLQSLLADMFLEASKELGIQFIVETHSEYLIRKSQVLVKKWYEENKDKDKECPFQAYYIPSGGTPYSLGYRQDGKFAESFGPGFYDESANLTFEIM